MTGMRSTTIRCLVQCSSGVQRTESSLSRETCVGRFAEAVIAGVIGPVGAPQVLLLGRPNHEGRLQVAGRTTDLSPTIQAAVAAVLRPHYGVGHPWPAPLPRSRWGRGGPAEPLAYTRVHPEVVVELVVDPATDGPRWRHPARFVRLRLDLHVSDRRAADSAFNSTDRPS